MTDIYTAAKNLADALEGNYLRADIVVRENLAALRAALTAVPEPVAYQYLFDSPMGGKVWRFSDSLWNGNNSTECRPLYAAPPERKPLTDAEIDRLWERMGSFHERGADWRTFARKLEAAHGIKE